MQNSQVQDPNTKVNEILDILEDINSEYTKLTSSYIDKANSRFKNLDLFNRRMEKIFGYMKEITQITNPRSQFNLLQSPSPQGARFGTPTKQLGSKKDLKYEEKILKIKAILLDPSLQSSQFIDEKARLILEAIPMQTDKHFAHLSDTPDSIAKGLETIRKQMTELKTKMDRVRLNNEGRGFSIKQPSVAKLMDELGSIQELLTQFTFTADDVVSDNATMNQSNGSLFETSRFQNTPNTMRSNVSMGAFTFQQSPMNQGTFVTLAKTNPHMNQRSSVATALPEKIQVDCNVSASALTPSLTGDALTVAAYASPGNFLVVKYGQGLSLFKDGQEFFSSKPIYCNISLNNT